MKAKFHRWLLPSLPDAVFIAIFFRVLFLASQLFNDPDAGMHIRMGVDMLSSWKVPRVDIYSFTSQGLPYLDHEWLSQAVFGSVYAAGGLTAVVIFSSLIIAVTFALLFHLLCREGRTLWSALGVTLLAIAASSPSLSARPHLFTILLAVVFFSIVRSHARDRSPRQLWLLPPLMVLWANLHGGFVMGFIIVGAFWVGAAGTCVFGKDEDRANGRVEFRHLGILLVGLLMAAMCNPWGPKLLLFPFRLVGQEYAIDHIQEWRSPDFHEDHVIELLILVIFLIAALSRRLPSIGEILCIIAFVHLSLFAVRNVPLLAMISGFALAEGFEDLVTRPIFSRLRPVGTWLSAKSRELLAQSDRARGRLLPVVVVLGISTSVMMGGGRIGSLFGPYELSPKRYPVEAFAFFEKEQLAARGNLFQAYYYGGYWIFRKGADAHVFIDGRQDPYPAQVVKDYFKVSGLDPRWREIMEKYKIRVVVYQTNSSLSALLLEDQEWALIYSDPVASIFVKRTPENTDLITKYPGLRLAVRQSVMK